MKVFRGQAKNLRKNIKQNNIKPLLMVFGVLVTITLTYKASNGVMGVGNTAFKEGSGGAAGPNFKGVWKRSQKLCQAAGERGERPDYNTCMYDFWWYGAHGRGRALADTLTSPGKRPKDRFKKEKHSKKWCTWDGGKCGIPK